MQDPDIHLTIEATAQTEAEAPSSQSVQLIGIGEKPHPSATLPCFRQMEKEIHL